MNEEDKKKEVKYPVGEERLTIGGFRNFQEFQIDKQIELIEDLIIKLNKKAEADKKEAERFETLLAELCKEFISLQCSKASPWPNGVEADLLRWRPAAPGEGLMD